MVCQRKRVEGPYPGDPVAGPREETEITRESRCVAPDVDHDGRLRRGDRADHLLPRTGPRRVQDDDVGRGLEGGQAGGHLAAMGGHRIAGEGLVGRGERPGVGVDDVHLFQPAEPVGVEQGSGEHPAPP